MANTDPILPPHVTLLGETLQPLLRKVEGKRPVITGCLQGDACWMMEAPERR